MQVSVENTGGLERRLTVRMPGGEIQVKIDARLRELSKQVRIKGFRPGRVPISVIRQRYGKQARAEIVNETMQDSLRQALREENLRPAGTPRVDSAPAEVDDGDLEFTALLEVYPEFEKVDVSDLAITRPQAEVTERDVDEMLDTLRKQRMNWEEVERKAAAGDRVQIEYAAETDEGRVPEEGTQRLNLFMVGTNFEKLEKAVASTAPGEEKTVKLLFPDDYQEPRLAGKKAKVDLKVVSVSEGTLPEVDEEFIKSFGIEDGTLESLRQEIRANLERELKQATTAVLKKQVIGALVDSVPDFDAPAGIVRNEAASLAAQMASARGLEPDPAMVEPFMNQARQRVRAGLLMGAVAEQNAIRIDAAKVRATIETIASTYEEPAEVMQMYYGNERLLEQVESSVMEEQVVDWVLENAKVTSREMDFQDVISQAGQ